MPVQQGPSFDRFLMRMKDFIIIGTAIAAMANWFIKRSSLEEQRFRILEDRMANVERIVGNAKRWQQ